MLKLKCFFACALWLAACGALAAHETGASEWVSMGQKLFQQNDYPDACLAFQNALSLDRQSKAANEGLGKCYEAEGDPDKALEYYKRALAAKTDASVDAKSDAASSQAPGNPSEPVQPRLQVGLGWPDLRLRVRLFDPVDAEAKAAIAAGTVALGARIYWRAAQLGSMDLELGGEAGWLSYSGIDTLNGSGVYAEPLVGVQYRFLKDWSALVDIGPAWIQVSSQGQSLTEMQWTLNTALYFSIL